MNKTPRANVVVTVSVRNRRVVAINLVVLFVVGLILVTILGEDSDLPNHSSNQANTSTTNLNVGEQTYSLERVTTLETQGKGLSGRDGLGKNKGMIFVFDSPQEVCMWMKDMQFSIDMVWVDQPGKITKIEKNVTPQTYPTVFCQQDTLNVIELDSGTSDVLGLQVGQRLAL